jgi:hypothetical protein
MVRYASTLTASRLRSIPRFRLCIIRDAISESDWDHSCAADVFFQCDVFWRTTYLLKYFTRFGSGPRLLLIIQKDYCEPRRCKTLCTSISNIFYLINNVTFSFGWKDTKTTWNFSFWPVALSRCGGERIMNSGLWKGHFLCYAAEH